MSSPDEDASAPTHPILPSLQLESLDPAELWQKLDAVEKALPHLLLCLKPILARLGSFPSSSLTSEHPLSKSLREEEGMQQDEEGGGEPDANQAVAAYMEILDEIQEVLRNAALYLRKTNASTNTLRPPPPTAIPTPFASTLPQTAGQISTDATESAELGLYASRIESRVLDDMKATFLAMKEEKDKARAERLKGRLA